MAGTPASSRSSLQAPAVVSGGSALDFVPTLVVTSPQVAGDGINIFEGRNSPNGDLVFEVDVDGLLRLTQRTTGGALQVIDSTGAQIALLPVSSATRDAFRFGKTGGARLRLASVYAASPADPPTGETDIMVVDTGAAQVLRVRYNDGGTMRVGDLSLV